MNDGYPINTLVCILLLLSIPCVSARYAEADIVNRNAYSVPCPGGIDTDTVTWQVKKGSCDAAGIFTPVKCEEDWLVIAPPGATVKARCTSGQIPDPEEGTICFRISWCGTSKTLDYAAQSCTGTDCPCENNPDKLCCTGGKWAKNPARYDQLCAELKTQSFGCGTNKCGPNEKCGDKACDAGYMCVDSGLLGCECQKNSKCCSGACGETSCGTAATQCGTGQKCADNPDRSDCICQPAIDPCCGTGHCGVTNCDDENCQKDACTCEKSGKPCAYFTDKNDLSCIEKLCGITCPGKTTACAQNERCMLQIGSWNCIGDNTCNTKIPIIAGQTCTGTDCPCENNPEKLCCTGGKWTKDQARYDDLCTKLTIQSASTAEAVLEAGLEGQPKGKTVNAKVGEKVFFDPTKSHPGDKGTIGRWSIAFEREGLIEYADNPPLIELSHTYDKPGTYTAKLQVRIDNEPGDRERVSPWISDTVTVNVKEPSKSCQDLGGSCGCPEGKVCKEGMSAPEASGCESPQVCCKECVAPVNIKEDSCEKLGGTCGDCPAGKECTEEGRINGVPGCPSCCVCSSKNGRAILEVGLEGQPPGTEVRAKVGQTVYFRVSPESRPAWGYEFRRWRLDYMEGVRDYGEPLGESQLRYVYSAPGIYKAWLEILQRKKEDPSISRWVEGNHVTITVEGVFSSGSEAKSCGSLDPAATCGCSEGMECISGNVVLGSVDCPSTCCRCTKVVDDKPARAVLKAGMGDESLADIGEIGVLEGDIVHFSALAVGGSEGLGFESFRLVYDGANPGSSEGEKVGDAPFISEHRYDKAGTYVAELTVTDEQGRTAKDSVAVKVISASESAEKGAFIISDGNWMDVLELVPIAVNGREKYPLLVYEQGYPNPDVLGEFLKRYKPERVVFIGQPPGAVSDAVSAYTGLGAEALLIRSSSDYFSYWGDAYTSVVYVEDNYELALLASTYASLLDVPLVVRGSGRDADNVFSGKSVICVFSAGAVAGRDCAQSFTLESLREEYLKQTGTDKIIVVHPGDISSTGAYSKTSLLAPVLASAKKELIISFQTSPSEMGDTVKTAINGMISSGKNVRFLTIMSNGWSFPYSRPTRFYYMNTDNVLADLDDDMDLDLPVGRVMAPSLSGLSGYVGNAIYYQDRTKPEKNSVLLLDSIGHPSDPNKPGIITGKLSEIVPEYADEYDIWLQNNVIASSGTPSTDENGRSFIRFFQHGTFYGGESFVFSVIPYLDNAVLHADSCDTCTASFSRSTPCFAALEKGAIVYFGNVGPQYDEGTGRALNTPWPIRTSNLIASNIYLKLSTIDKTIGELYMDEKNAEMAYRMSVIGKALNEEEMKEKLFMGGIFVGDPTVRYAFGPGGG